MVELTKYAGKGGCACKMGAHILANVLQSVTFPTNANVLADMSGADDAGIYKISDDIALVQTLDFFTPIVDDPFQFGVIAATNSLSDVYAMGGTPMTTMNIVAFPVPLVEAGALTAVLQGATSVLEKAGVAVVGGHTIENEVPLFGLSVTGHVHPNKVWRNNTPHIGDALVLTKPIGTGIMSTALKGKLFPMGTAEASESMATLNKVASEVAHNFTIHSCTDVTGFSLLGHGKEMAGDNVTLRFRFQDIPVFSDVYEAARMGLVPAATYGNRKAIGDVYFHESMDETQEDICYDPQTSGGLLLAVPADEAKALVDALHRAGAVHSAVVGSVEVRGDYPLVVE